eukprot:9473753-Pyramimonas_sp.AAC.1
MAADAPLAGCTLRRVTAGPIQLLPQHMWQRGAANKTSSRPRCLLTNHRWTPSYQPGARALPIIPRDLISTSGRSQC